MASVNAPANENHDGYQFTFVTLVLRSNRHTRPVSIPAGLRGGRSRAERPLVSKGDPVVDDTNTLDIRPGLAKPEMRRARALEHIAHYLDRIEQQLEKAGKSVSGLDGGHTQSERNNRVVNTRNTARPDA
jgi:hypothetical protein